MAKGKVGAKAGRKTGGTSDAAAAPVASRRAEHSAEWAAEPGVREQKRRATRARLTMAAKRLFVEQGFDGTTVDEIAAAAGISRRTFFLHFATKEDAVLSRDDDFKRELAAAVRAAPPGRNVLELAEGAVRATLERFDVEEARVTERLLRDTPALRARSQGKQEWLERTIADALATRPGAVPGDALRLRVDAVLIAAVLRLALEGWVAASTSGATTAEHVRRVVETLQRSLRGRDSP